jgi:tRNA-specific 2-thiouridylase
MNKWATVNNFNWLLDEKNVEKLLLDGGLSAKFRYRQKDAEVNISFSSDSKKIRFDFVIPQRAITPGQYAVLYKQDLCLGGGIILSEE